MGPPVLDIPVTVGLGAQIGVVAEKISSIAEVVGVARKQLATLHTVTEAIRNVRYVIRDGVQGLVGSVAEKVGLKDVFLVGKELQKTGSGAMELYRSVRSLGPEAQQQLRNMGVAVGDLQQYLAEGVVYDAFQGLDVSDWLMVARDPLDAMAKGALGRAADRASSYTNLDEIRKAYADELAGLSPEERARFSASSGLDMGALGFYAWAKRMKNRVAKTVEFAVLADKLTDAVGGKGQSPTITSGTASLDAVGLAIAKVEITNGHYDTEAGEKNIEQRLLRTQIGRRATDDANAATTAAAMTVTPD